ncbi:hypothetical protein F4604DRAFT_2029613 [Suillus subluteus]|nr:hypothetical protein F4604DRAFT_2029613 [Suillus subluteus]
MTNFQTSGLPQGVGGKNTSALNQNFRVADADATRIAGAIGSSRSRVTHASRDDIIAENEARAKHDEARANHRATMTDAVEDDEDLLIVPAEERRELPNPRPVDTDTPMISLFRGYNALTPGSRAGFEALVTNVITASSSSAQPQAISDPSVVMPAYAFDDGEVKFFTSFDNAFEIPRVIIDLAKSHIHVPLTLLTPLAFEKIHTDPSCIKMRKGMILDDPKKLVLDASGFPAETTLQPADFHEATENFMQLLEHIAGPAIIERFKRHRKFCLSRKPFVDNYEAILAFDIETQRMFLSPFSEFTRIRRTAKGDNVPIEANQPTWAHGNKCTMIDRWADEPDEHEMDDADEPDEHEMDDADEPVVHEMDDTDEPDEHEMDDTDEPVVHEMDDTDEPDEHEMDDTDETVVHENG